MKYEPVDSQLFINNRQRLNPLLKSNSIVILHSNDIMPTNADGVMPFKQNSDFYYLTGIDQEESILILYPDALEEKHREILFVRRTDQHIAVWEGEKLSLHQASKLSGIQTVHWTEQFDAVLQSLIYQSEYAYLLSNEHIRSESRVVTRNERYINSFIKQFPLQKLERLAPLMTQLRMVKDQLEIAQIRRACQITEDGFRRVLKYIRPGVGEWKIEAEYAHEFLRQRSNGFAYTPIIASGKNSCILHYVDNHEICLDGEIILMDVGAEYANWNADMTRTVPVNGKFSKRQRQVYDAVLRTLRYANTILRPGTLYADYQNAVIEFIEGELIGLGLIDAEEAKQQGPDKALVKRYFMHGTSHHLGLDVHDVSCRHTPFQVGNVFTIEPGIYIPEEAIGIRLENNYLIGEKENLDLMATIPIEADEIEALMASQH
ncbi:aminopeptidase P N-terminal domain-containing protein [Persicirhabdus sediminis]|uniref:Xaa-Pro aminopeptidase n=1 Tax=Persicirhabdus sediminis TaxID=454144 RepID=A0A8J7SL54_9BACT|nr:aminopeptidase P N-terminal domain-containing protein [Persicirhabdus sediminis]MBK1791200.1 aminopeptidase P N-terminal domain-containing protein [Persicirhabdus sediminis]